MKKLLFFLIILSSCINSNDSHKTAGEIAEEKRIAIEIENYRNKTDSISRANLQARDSYYNSPAGRQQRKIEIADSIRNRKREVVDSLKSAKRAEKINSIVNKYSCTQEQAQAILQGKVSIGMSREMCVAAWGRPEHINTTTSMNYSHEQWVYGLRSYLYFEDGTLTTIQN